MMYYIKFDTLIGNLIVVEKDNKINEIVFPNGIDNYELVNMKEMETDLLLEAKKQLNLYFNKQLKVFDLPLNIIGTEFQQKVYNALLDIPYGQTCTYQDIAIKVGSSKAVRAVGNTNNKNKIPIIIPCHRVIGKNNKLVGFGGGLDLKQRLLDLEKE